MSKGYVYLYHFQKKVCPDRHTCQHYIGYCADLWERNDLHQNGRAARLTQVAIERNIKIKIVRVWKGSRTDERQLKNRKNAPRLCPICNQSPQPVECLKELTPAEIKQLLAPAF